MSHLSLNASKQHKTNSRIHSLPLLLMTSFLIKDDLANNNSQKLTSEVLEQSRPMVWCAMLCCLLPT